MQIAKRPDPERLHVLAAALRVWLLDLCVWMAEWLGMRLPRGMRLASRRALATGLRETRLLVFLLAFARLRVPVLVARTMRPLSAPPGFRRARDTGGDARVFTRGLRLTGFSVAARLRALCAIFADLGAAVRRMLKHLRKRWRGPALVMRAAVAAILRALTDKTPRSLDTS